ncbi:MAG: CDP-alcohol phosphatidyltransferase family protein [Gemmatimonadota bacterium]|nr:CDP-alcohol phosphatidyltransferase family protein [Gemmatimonadota bacterium]MDE3173750.1 CDP-alcohol phosphatidyltransferase family protein [Gemmatimonadota bacterium]MDE3215191.1 CDP-alcohol phosphatidyltransferase family protein [Gemmatimonadota bacterium]
MHARRGLRQVPNWISFSRLVMAGAFVASDNPPARIVLVVVAAITDFLDGYIARRAEITSRWGALLDAIADRVFVLVAVSAFLFEGRLDTAGYFVLLSRDLMTAVGFLVARIIPWLRPVKFRSRPAGKFVTVLQFLTFITIMVRPTWVTALLGAVLATSCWAVIDYTLALWRERAR